jgi:hypothetical protein
MSQEFSASNNLNATQFQGQMALAGRRQGSSYTVCFRCRFFGRGVEEAAISMIETAQMAVLSPRIRKVLRCFSLLFLLLNSLALHPI